MTGSYDGRKFGISMYLNSKKSPTQGGGSAHEMVSYADAFPKSANGIFCRLFLNRICQL